MSSSQYPGQPSDGKQKQLAGSADIAEQIQKLMEEKGITLDEASIALAIDDRLAQQDPVMGVANGLLSVATLLNEAFFKRVEKFEEDNGDLSDEAFAAKFAEELGEEGLRLAPILNMAANTGFAAREEQRKAIIFGEQSAAVAHAEKEFKGQKQPGFASEDFQIVDAKPRKKPAAPGPR
jgi:hypothetical protein